MSVEALRKAWPLDELYDMKPMENLPLPMARPDQQAEQEIMLASAQSDSTALSSAYYQAAISRGATWTRPDPVTTATYSAAPVNDLY